MNVWHEKANRLNKQESKKPGSNLLVDFPRLQSFPVVVLWYFLISQFSFLDLSHSEDLHGHHWFLQFLSFNSRIVYFFDNVWFLFLLLRNIFECFQMNCSYIIDCLAQCYYLLLCTTQYWIELLHWVTSKPMGWVLVTLLVTHDQISISDKLRT